MGIHYAAAGLFSQPSSASAVTHFRIDVAIHIQLVYLLGIQSYWLHMSRDSYVDESESHRLGGHSDLVGDIRSLPL